jgi:hypothetical protein
VRRVSAICGTVTPAPVTRCTTSEFVEFGPPFDDAARTSARNRAAARASAAGAKWLWWQRVIAGLWSLMSGTVVVMALEALLSV